MSRGLHRPDQGSSDGEVANTGLAEAGPLSTPASTRVYRSALNAEERVGLGSGLVLAIGLHALLIAAALILPRFFDKPVQHRAVIMARLVALGKARDPHLLPRKESPPPAAAAPAPGPVLPPPAKPSTAPTRPGPAPSRAAPRAPTRQELMERALARAAGKAVAEPKQLPDPERAGDESGSSSGTSAVAEAGERYFTEVHDAIAANYAVPSVISERERLYLTATVIAYIGATGALLRHELQKKSGNHFFDEALEQAIKNTRLPPPPPELVKSLRDEGVALNFKP